MNADMSDLQAQLRATERSEAAPWVRPDRSPAPTAALVGMLVGAWVLNNALVEAPLWILGHVAFTLVLLVVWFGYWRSPGAMPRGRVPREVVGPMYLALVGGAAVGLGVWALAVLVTVWVAAPVGALAAAALFLIFDRSYAAASDRLRERTAGGDA